LTSNDISIFQMIEWARVFSIGILGTIENGALMLLWYKLLNRYIGCGIATYTVLAKCLLDQLFYATQQDGIFLALCAYLHFSDYHDVWNELKVKFLTTWLNDCSVWPLINFIGFSFVPYKLQPTYMSIVQFFWQIYMSTMASPSSMPSSSLNDTDVGILQENDITVKPTPASKKVGGNPETTPRFIHYYNSHHHNITLPSSKSTDSINTSKPISVTSTDFITSDYVTTNIASNINNSYYKYQPVSGIQHMNSLPDNHLSDATRNAAISFGVVSALAIARRVIVKV